MRPLDKTPKLIYTAAALVTTAGLGATSLLAQGGLKPVQKVAEPEDVQVRNGLEVRYAEEHGVPQGYAEAASWFRRAAEQGHGGAQHTLGVRYAEGLGVPQDYTEVVRWFHLAAEQGHAGAQNSLGVRYAEGQGVPQDHTEAVRWFRLAAEQGDRYAQDNLETIETARRSVTTDDVEADLGVLASVEGWELTHEKPDVDAAPRAEDARSTVALGDEDCFEEVASVDYGDWSEALENNRFRYAFQHIEDYPYYRRVEDVFVGIKTSRWFPNGIVPGAVYWRFVDGRQGVGAEGHYSLIQDFRGRAAVRGVSVNVNSGDDFAYFLYDRASDRGSSYYANATGRIGVMTTTDDGVEFIEIGGLRPWNTRFMYYEDHRGRHFDWNDAILNEKLFRTVFFIEDTVTIAGVEHGVNRICRLGYSPLAATNSDELVPAIEDELTRRGERIHAMRIVNHEVPATQEERRASFRSLAPDTLVRVLTVPDGHVGDIRRNDDLFGDVAITFTRDPYSDEIYYRRQTELIAGIERDGSFSDFYVEGRLSVNGKDLGAPVVGYLGRYYRCCDEDTESLKFQRFDMRWPPQNQGRGSAASRQSRLQRQLQRQGLRVQCEAGECGVFAMKRNLSGN